MNRRSLLDIAIVSIVFTGVAFLASLGLTIFGLVKSHRRRAKGPASISWIKASMILTTTWSALSLAGLIAPDTSVTDGVYDEDNPNFHVNAIAALIGMSTFVTVLFTQIEIVRDFKTPATPWISRKPALIVLGTALLLTSLRLILAEVLIFDQMGDLGFGCNLIDVITIFLLLSFGVAAFVFLMRAKDAIKPRIFNYLLAIYVITSSRLTYQSVYTLMFFIGTYSLNLGVSWTIYMEIPTIFVSAWSTVVCLGLMFHIASLWSEDEASIDRISPNAEKKLGSDKGV